MTKYDQDDMRRPHGARHPLAALPQALLDSALRGARQVSDIIGSADDADYDDVVEPILIALRADGWLRLMPLFVASPDSYVVDDSGLGDAATGQVLDMHDWPHSEDVTELLFGAPSIPWEKAVWAAQNLNTDYAIGPEAWQRHQEKIKEGAK